MNIPPPPILDGDQIPFRFLSFDIDLLSLFEYRFGWIASVRTRAQIHKTRPLDLSLYRGTRRLSIR